MVKKFHEELHHVGSMNQTLASLSRNIWIILAREAIREHGDFSYRPFTYFACGEAIAEVVHLELIFISCPYLSFLRKIFMVQGVRKTFMAQGLRKTFIVQGEDKL